MRQPRNSVEAFLPVSNISEEQVLGLERTLAEDTGLETDPKTLRKLFAPARNPRFRVATAEEIVNFHDAIGFGEMDEEYAEDLAHYLRRSLSGLFADVVTPFTPPVSLDPLDGGSVLSVAPSPRVMKGRSIVKTALAIRHGLAPDKFPHGVFLNDNTAASVWVAQSDGPATNDLIHQAYVELSSNDQLLDDYLCGQPVDVHASLV